MLLHPLQNRLERRPQQGDQDLGLPSIMDDQLKHLEVLVRVVIDMIDHTNRQGYLSVITGMTTLLGDAMAIDRHAHLLLAHFVGERDIGLATGPPSDMTGEIEDVLDHHRPIAGRGDIEPLVQGAATTTVIQIFLFQEDLLGKCQMCRSLF